MTENTKQEAALRNKTLSVLANINAVEGFDPHMVTACYQDTEGNGRMYLQAEFSMLWFRLKYPNGRLEQVLSRMNDQMATVEGRVYDNDGNLLANAFVTRYRGDEQFGKDYVQNAGTAAIRKALGNCGFGTPADAVYIEGVTPLFKAAEDEDVPVDAGVQTRIPIPPVPKEYQQNAEPAPAAPKRGRKPAAKPAPAPAPVPTPAPVPEPVPVKEEMKAVPAPAPVTAPAPAATPVPNPIPIPPTPKPAPVGVPKTMEEAENFVIPFGVFHGMTMKDTLAKDGGARVINYIKDSPRFAGQPIQVAAQMFAGQHAGENGL